MATLAAIDIGYSYLKAINQNGKKVLFPSNVLNVETGRSPRDADESLNFSNNPLNNLDVVVDHKMGTPTRYYVGRKAEDNGGSIVNEADRLNSEYGRVIALTALALLAENDEEEFIVSTGLPISHYNSKIRERYINNFPGEYKVEFKSGPLKGTTKTIKVLAVRVYKQGMGCFFDMVLDQNGDEVEEHPLLSEDGTVHALIDVGSETTNFELYKNRSIIDGGSASINEGIKKVYPAIKQLISADYPDIKDGDLDWLFRKDSLDGYDIKSVKDKELKKLASTIENKTTDLWRPHKLNMINGNVYVGGGGGAAVFDFLPYNNKVLISDPQFANARGFLKVLTLAYRLGKVEINE